MGITCVTGTVVGPSGEEGLDFLVDSGAQYTLLPEVVWKRIGLIAQRRQRFRLAGGTLIEREIANCIIRLAEFGETPTPVVLGQASEVALLGAVTLEELGLTFDRTSRALHRAPVLTL